MTRSDRAVSVQVNYILAILIITTLMAGLMLATADQLQRQEERTADAEFDVLANRVAADLSAADRLAISTENTSAADVEVRTNIPSTSAGSSYDIRVNATEVVADEVYEVEVVFTADNVDVTRSVSLKTGTDVVNTSIGGGAYTIDYVDSSGDGVPDALEVQDG